MRTARRFLAVAAALLFLAAPPVARGDFYATDRATDNVYKIDPKNGACTLVGNCGVDASLSGLAYDGWTLWASDLYCLRYGWSLGTIDLQGGWAIVVGPQNEADVHALAYKDDVMYGFTPWGTMGTVSLWTGEYVPLFSGLPAMIGADVDESTNTIYAIGGDNNLYTVDETTGTATLVGPTGVSFNWRAGLAWYPGDGNLYAVGDDDQAGLGDGLYRVNKFTGAATLVGRTMLQEADSLEYVPVTDSFEADVFQGEVFGWGSGYMDGTWFYYPDSQWYNQWFYDHPLDMERRKVIDLSFDVYGSEFDPGWLEVVINWATPQWPPGTPYPPIPGEFPPGMEDQYIGRELVYVNAGHDEYGVQVHYEIPYNPEWISIDIRDLSGTGSFYITNGRIVHDCLPKVYRLTVNSGSGGGIYASGTLVQIIADAPPPESFFDIWVGDASILDAPSSPVAIATMPPQDAAVTATYLPYGYRLTVNSGSGGGTYAAGTLVQIIADPSPPDSFFDVWFGDVWILDNPLSPVAIATMPAQNVEVTATYTGPRTDQFYALMVQGQVVPAESGGSGYSNGTWYSYPRYGWHNQWFYDHHFDLERRKVIDLTFDVYDVQAPGMIEVAINWATPQWPPGTPYPPLPGLFPPEMEDVYIGREVVYRNPGHDEYGVQVHYEIPYNPEWISIDIRDLNLTGMGCFRIRGQMIHDCVPKVVYRLTVNSGSGSGTYAAGTLVQIIADTPPPDSFFDIWVGDAWILDDPSSPVAIATMPPQDAAVTATYLPYEYVLTVNSGSGGGTYAAGTLVQIIADPAPPDSFFDVWMGDVWMLDNPLSPVAIATMPAQNVEVTATYTGPRTDQFYALMVQGQVVPPESGGTGYGNGTWYSYPRYSWYNQWFYDHRFDLERRKVIDLTFDVFDVQAPGMIEVAINWATPQWPPGTPYPPLPGMFPPEMEDEYIGRQVVYVNAGHEEYGIQVHYVIPYNPEWVSIDIREVTGVGFFRIRGQMVHDCVPYVYTLTVNSGSGSGTYAAGTIVAIAANAPPVGTVFKVWVGDIAGIADTRASSTTETMPALDQTITATYKLRGDLNEDGFVGQGDLNIVLAQWGRGMPGNPPITDPRADANHDGVVGQGDLNIVLADWGKRYP